MAINITKEHAVKNSDDAVSPKAPESDELDVFGEIRQLTETFRSSLKPWRDANGAIKRIMIDGAEEILRCADTVQIKQYVMQFTAIWKPQSKKMKHEMRDEWQIDCRALYIDGSWTKTPKEWGPVRFDHSIIRYCHLFSGQTFMGSANFHNVEFMEHAQFQSSNFKKDVNFNGAVFPDGADFSNVRFDGVASFERVSTLGGILNFSKASFRRAPVFHATTLPQGTSFDGTTFSINYRKLLQSEVEEETRAFRTLKQAAAGYRGQQDEAEFFAQEQNARRIAFLAPHLVGKTDASREWKSGLRPLMSKYTWDDLGAWRFSFSPLEWFISLLYGAISGYGRSPGRALSWFAAVNMITVAVFFSFFSFGHCKTNNSNYCSVSDMFTSAAPAPVPSYEALSPAAHLAVQNLLNPAGLVTEKALISVRHPLMLLISILQLTSSYLILFLVALAVRTRFQKGSGGDR